MTQPNLTPEESYAYALYDYLQQLILLGQITYEQADAIIDQTNDLTGKGASIHQLPLYQKVSRWSQNVAKSEYQKALSAPSWGSEGTWNPFNPNNSEWQWNPLAEKPSQSYNKLRERYAPLFENQKPQEAMPLSQPPIQNPEALDPIRASMTPAELYINQLTDYIIQTGMSKEEGDALYNEGLTKASQGYIGESLPLFKEVSQVVGANTWQAYQAKTQPQPKNQMQDWQEGQQYATRMGDVQRYKQEEKQRELEMRAQRIGSVKSYEQMYRPYLETQNFSPNQRAYAERSFNNIAFDFENTGGAGRRQDWYNQQLQPSEEFTYGGGTLPEDPWQSYLKQHPFLENWNKLSMEQRGETRNRLTPRARWMG